jgi:CheY-like chemotaxis protein
MADMSPPTTSFPGEVSGAGLIELRTGCPGGKHRLVHGQDESGEQLESGRIAAQGGWHGYCVQKSPRFARRADARTPERRTCACVSPVQAPRGSPPGEPGEEGVLVTNAIDHLKNRPSVLVVDDCPEDREQVRRLLSTKRTRKFKLLDAETGQEAIDLLYSHKVECVVLDYGLPGMDGIELISYVRSDYYGRDVAIILISGVGNERIVADAFKAGADYYLEKSSLRRHLWPVVDQAIRRAALPRPSA